ncbi:glutamate-cysteine ligase modifier subunit [Niveomyces insectorum RCEF 264]|uniref:GCS light chain n=1 Tax=Niveomyces insectorum RCEF 264 TaxID=1081102 RepID=A0A168A2B6_9HYPO|nr:glutamate-cysteine ligase modifier subunit [Niveomyces insectorum RCEF 264]
MLKLILSTGNIVSGGPSIVRKPGAYRSNFELTNSLRSNFLAAQAESNDESRDSASTSVEGSQQGRTTPPANGRATATATATATTAAIAKTSSSTTTTTTTATTTPSVSPTRAGNGHANGGADHKKRRRRQPPLAAWTYREGSVLYVPRIDWPLNAGADVETRSSSSGSSSSGGLQEEETQYDITVKLFFLPQASVADRAQYAEEALALVFRELGVDRIDLLVLSFPGMSFEGDCEWEADKINALQGNDDEEVATWAATAETFAKQGRVRRLGVAEFGSEKLARFLDRVAVPPAVDQINVRNCCNVPPPLVALAKDKGIELLVHTDCTDILPPGTLRELLGPGPRGAGVLADGNSSKRPVGAKDGNNGTGMHEVGNTSRGSPSTTESTDAAPPDALSGDITPQWVIKYTAVVRNRGVIENMGYFAGAGLQTSANGVVPV